MRIRIAGALAAAFVLAFAAAARPALAEGGPALDLESIDAYVSVCVARYRIPGLSMAIVEDGKTVFSKGYGEAARGRRATADTQYVIGSTSKMFTALAVLRQVEDGKVDLDAPYKRYVPEFELAEPGEAERISVRQLLNMASGLTDRGLAPLSAGEASLEAELVRLRKGVLAAEPGSLYHYYTVNYRLLALLVERVSGRPFAELVERELFAPIGMASSRVDPRTAPSVAQGHGVFLGLPVARRQEIRASALASGMMVSTASDVAKYLEAELVVRAGAPAIGAVSAASLAASWSAPVGVGFSPSESLGEGVGYGMGWMVIDAAGGMGRRFGGGGKGELYLFHAGALENFQSAFFLDPNHRRGFAILMNQGGISAQLSINAVRDGVVSLFAGKDPGPLPRRPAVAFFVAILMLALAFSAFRVLRLGRWRRKAEARAARRDSPAPRDWIIAAAELAAVLAFVFGLIPLGNAVMGDYTDWTMISGMAPDALCALPVVLVGALVVAIFKARAFAAMASASRLTKGRD